MVYRVSVDLSAKVEQWTKDSAVAFSDGIQGSILIDSKVKQFTRDLLQGIYPGRSTAFYIYQALATFVYLLIRPHLKQIRHVEIDQDYPGSQSEGEIKAFLLNLLRRDKPTLRKGFISFRRVEGTKADLLARSIYQGQESADRKIVFKEVTQVLVQKK